MTQPTAKQCPCGGDIYVNRAGRLTYVGCEPCGYAIAFSGPLQTNPKGHPNNAIEAWNRRESTMRTDFLENKMTKDKALKLALENVAERDAVVQISIENNEAVKVSARDDEIEAAVLAERAACAEACVTIGQAHEQDGLFLLADGAFARASAISARSKA